MTELMLRGISVICLILWFAGAAMAKQGRVLTLEELDNEGKTTALGEDRVAIVDINSEIKVRLHRGALQKKIARLLGDGAVSGTLIDRATALQHAARTGLTLIKPLTEALAEWAQSDKTPQDVASLSRALELSADPTLLVIEVANKDPVLRDRLNAALEAALVRDRSRASQNRALFETAAAYADELKQTVDEALQEEGAYVQLGAWIVQDGQDRPLHLPGFDQYPEGDFFVVDQWTLLPLSEEQKQQLVELEAAAKVINEEGIGELVKVRNVANGAIVDFLDRAQGSVDRIERALESFRGAVEAEATSIRSVLDKARTAQQEYTAYVRSLKDRYAGQSARRFSSGAALLESTHNDLVELQHKTQGFVSGQIKYIAEVRSAVNASMSNMNVALAEVERVLQECRQELQNNVTDVAGQLSDLMGAVRLSQQINTAVLDFGKEVLKHTLDQIPENTKLDLKRAGARHAGDVVVLKLAAGSAQRQRQVLEERRLDLYRVLPHIQMAVGMIFADPSERTQVENRFQAAPSYSILLKGFGKRGITYNQLLRPGFGVNVSALDFDKDDTPELGIALVGSVFRDYFQVGYGYNVNEDAGYWFFGLRLPLATFTLPRPENVPEP